MTKIIKNNNIKFFHHMSSRADTKNHYYRNEPVRKVDPKFKRRKIITTREVRY